MEKKEIIKNPNLELLTEGFYIAFCVYSIDKKNLKLLDYLFNIEKKE